MTTTYFVIEDTKRFKWSAPDRVVISARDYLVGKKRVPKRARIVNLCSDTAYLGLGYYCSLLAEARRERMIPSVEVMLELGWKRIYSRAIPDLDAALEKALKKSAEEPEEQTILICFGETDHPKLGDFAHALFDAFRCPVLTATIRHKGKHWHVEDIDTPSLRKLDAAGQELFARALDSFTRRARAVRKGAKPPRYTLAVLYNPDEKLPPSDDKALKRLTKAGAELGVKVELITRKDLPRLLEYDALFIRETTALDHHTYRFAKRAETEGIPVIDDPTSILRCTNKVYLAELFRANNIPAPKTLLVDRENLGRIVDEIGFPVVLKVPDGSFSRGVKKAEDMEGLEAIATPMLKDSDLILAQEYVETRYDWRIGILNGTPIYACKYFMADGHWQIVKHEADGAFDEGTFETLPVDQAPPEVVDTALNAAALIGKGLYGVDVKETPKGIKVVEVNDNPSLDADVEDAILKDELWRMLIREFIRRIEAR